MGEPAVQTFEIGNIGTAILEVSDIVSDEAAFTISPTNFSLLPDDNTDHYGDIQSASEVGNYSGLLTIESNGGMGVISLTGVAQDVVVPTPSIFVLESAFEVTLNWGDMAIETLHIANNGMADLEFSLTLEGADLATAIDISLESGTDTTE